MGKGDKKTKRGKIIMGSFGVRRPKRLKIGTSIEVKPAADKVKTVKPEKEAAPKEKKKPATKKVVAETKEEAVATTPKKKTSRKTAEKETEKESEK